MNGLLQMGIVKSSTGDLRAFQEYSKKAIRASGEEGVSGALSNWLIDALEKAEGDLAAKAAERTSTGAKLEDQDTLKTCLPQKTTAVTTRPDGSKAGAGDRDRP